MNLHKKSCYIESVLKSGVVVSLYINVSKKQMTRPTHALRYPLIMTDEEAAKTLLVISRTKQDWFYVVLSNVFFGVFS